MRAPPILLALNPFPGTHKHRVHTKTPYPLLAALGLLFAGPVHAAPQTVSNGYLRIVIEDGGASAGQFTVTTGSSHPNPNETVLYPIGTGYITLRDAGASQVWVNRDTEPAPGLAGYTTMLMGSQPTTVVPLGSNGFRTTYTLPNFTVVQDVTVNGSTLADTNVRQTVTVTNTTTASRGYGLRNLWDWQIASNDASSFRQRNPDTAFTDVFQSFPAPAFSHYEVVDNAATPTFSIYGTVSGGTLSPAPTAPDQIRYAAWTTSHNSAWDFAVDGSAADSAIVYFWGYNSPLTLAAGASASHTQYLSTVLGAVGGTPVPPAQPAEATPVPTLSGLGLALLSGLVGLVAVRRRPRI